MARLTKEQADLADKFGLQCPSVMTTETERILSGRVLDLLDELRNPHGQADTGDMRGLYSIIQYCPDSYRAEAANIGVVLFIPSINHLAFSFSRGLDRVRKFFDLDDVELGRVREEAIALAHRLGVFRDENVSEKELNEFIATRAGRVQLTPLRLVVVRRGAVDSMLVELFDDAVVGRSREAIQACGAPTRARTTGPLQVNSLHTTLSSTDGKVVARIPMPCDGEGVGDTDVAAANAEHLSRCWNLHEDLVGAASYASRVAKELGDTDAANHYALLVAMASGGKS